MKKVFVVGSTGVLGRQALEVIKSYPENFRIIGISGYKNIDLLSEQSQTTQTKYVGASKELLGKLGMENSDKVIFDIEKELSSILEESDPDIILFLSNSISAIDGIQKALEMGKMALIANKESIIAAGEVLFKDEKMKLIVPVDSETSAIFQCLQGEKLSTVEKIILTASGGPFYRMGEEALKNISSKEALKHPNWEMGSKITIDSATLVNKAFEVIETHFLFDIPYENIDVVVHRESIVHSLVQFHDGQIKAVLSVPKMLFPIQYALFFPERMPNNFERLNLSSVASLNFEKLDEKRFPAFSIVLKYAKKGGSYLPSLVAVDEVLVNYFLNDGIKFIDYSSFFEKIMDKMEYKKIESLEDIKETYSRTLTFSNDYVRRRI